jgi:putative membrane protein
VGLAENRIYGDIVAEGMLLVLCVDRDDDLGRKTEAKTPVVGETQVREAAVELATADPEDSDVNVLFEGLRIADSVDQPVEIAAVTGKDGRDVEASRQIRRQLDWVIGGLDGDEVSAIVVTDGAQDESVLPVIRSRVTVDGVSRVVVRQAQDLESMYYTIKQVLADPETRGTLLVPLGILLLVYPLALVATLLDLPGTVFGLVSGLLGLYLLGRGFGVHSWLAGRAGRTWQALFAGRVALVTNVVAAALLVVGVVGGLQGVEQLQTGVTDDPGVVGITAAFVSGALRWVAAAGVTASFGRVTDEYLAGQFRWQYLNAPFYVVAISTVLHGVSAFLLGDASLEYVAVMLTTGTLLGLASTLSLAVAESRAEGQPT